MIYFLLDKKFKTTANFGQFIFYRQVGYKLQVKDIIVNTNCSWSHRFSSRLGQKKELENGSTDGFESIIW